MIKLCLECGTVMSEDAPVCACGGYLKLIENFEMAVSIVYMKPQDRLEWALNGFETVNNYPQLPKGIKNA